jgi:outer membrane receptor protein involved in Fe transport
LRLDAAYSVSSQKYVEWVPQAARGATAAIDYSGKLIEQAPRDLASAQLTYSPKLLNGGRLGVEWSHTGRYAADPANTFFYEGYHLLSLSGNVILKRNAELFARLSNLTNSQYAELVSYDAFQKDQYTPGAPRSFYLGMRLSVER